MSTGQKGAYGLSAYKAAALDLATDKPESLEPEFTVANTTQVSAVQASASEVDTAPEISTHKTDGQALYAKLQALVDDYGLPGVDYALASYKIRALGVEAFQRKMNTPTHFATFDGIRLYAPGNFELDKDSMPGGAKITSIALPAPLVRRLTSVKTALRTGREIKKLTMNYLIIWALWTTYPSLFSGIEQIVNENPEDEIA